MVPVWGRIFAYALSNPFLSVHLHASLLCENTVNNAYMHLHASLLYENTENNAYTHPHASLVYGNTVNNAHIHLDVSLLYGNTASNASTHLNITFSKILSNSAVRASASKCDPCESVRSASFTEPRSTHVTHVNSSAFLSSAKPTQSHSADIIALTGPAELFQLRNNSFIAYWLASKFLIYELWTK